jgi:hypothetical protein
VTRHCLVLLLAGAAAAATGCSRSSGQRGSAAATGPGAARTASGPTKEFGSQDSELCAGRPRCEVQRSRAAGGTTRVVDLLLRPDADADPDECNPREYWRIWSDQPPRLLAVDCDQQRSAEEAAAAKTEVANGRFVVDYVEFQASDRCERYRATLDLATLSAVSEERLEGPTDPRGCHASTRIKALAPKGDGSRGHPILRLHTTWRDVHGSR